MTDFYEPGHKDNVFSPIRYLYHVDRIGKNLQEDYGLKSIWSLNNNHDVVNCTIAIQDAINDSEDNLTIAIPNTINEVADESTSTRRSKMKALEYRFC